MSLLDIMPKSILRNLEPSFCEETPHSLQQVEILTTTCLDFDDGFHE